MSDDLSTKQVRAYDVRVGDELSFFDMKALREKTMVVVAVDLGFPGVQQLLLRHRRNGKRRFRWNMKLTAWVRVRRALKP